MLLRPTPFAQAQLAETLTTMAARVVPDASVAIAALVAAAS